MNVKAIRGEREREGVRGEPGMKEAAGSCRRREAGEIRGKKKGDEEYRPKHEENNRESSSLTHTHTELRGRQMRKTQKCERGDELSCGSSSAFPLWVFSLVSLRVSAESYGMSSSPCRRRHGTRPRGAFKPSRDAPPPSCCVFFLLRK